jgi:hypothetical protein
MILSRQGVSSAICRVFVFLMSTALDDSIIERIGFLQEQFAVEDKPGLYQNVSGSNQSLADRSA